MNGGASTWVQGSLWILPLCPGWLWQAALAQCKGLKDEQKQQWELQNKNRELLSLKQSVPKREQDAFCSDNQATEFLVQLHNKKNKVTQVSYSHTKSWYVLCAPQDTKKLLVLCTCCVLLEYMQWLYITKAAVAGKKLYTNRNSFTEMQF